MLNARHAVSAAAAALATLAAAAAPASAGIWSPVASGTTANITAIDDAAPGALVYGTASGQLLKNGTVRSANPGYSITDVALNPSGGLALATATNGRLLRSTNGGDSWSTVSLANTSYAQTTTCANSPSGPVPKSYTPSGNLQAVAWAGDTVAYVVPTDLGVVLKSTDGGASWTDVSRRADNTCLVNPGSGDVLSDVGTVPGSDLVWLVAAAFGKRFVSSNGLASSPQVQTDSGVNCYDHRPRLALDPDNPNRAFMTDTCNGALVLGFTSDGGTTFDWPKYFAGDGNAMTGLNDVAVAGGSAVAVGNGGSLLVDNDGRNAYFQRADGPLLTTDWLSVSKRSATHAVVGGSGGALIQTDAATTIPDLAPPVVPTPTPPTTPTGPGATVPPTTTAKPTKTTTASVPGATIKLGVPSACVAPGQTFTVTLTWKKQKRKGNRFVKVRRADFYIGSKRVKIDKSAPYTQKLTVKAGTEPGSTVTVRARAFVKVKKGKSPTKSIKASVKVC